MARSQISLRALQQFLFLWVVVALLCQPLLTPGYVHAKTLNAVYPSPAWNSSLPVTIGRQFGMFNSEGLDVRPTYVRGGPIIIAALLSGEADFAIMGGITAITSINRGADVVIIGGHTAHLDQALIAAKGISTVSDLKGKVIGVTGSGGVTEFATVEALRRKGLVRDRDYRVMFTSNSPMRVNALENGIIQAAPFSATERGLLEAKGFPTLFEIGKAIPELPFVVIVTTNLKAKSQPAEVFAFLRAIRNSITFIRSETRKTILFLSKVDPSANTETLEKSLNYVIDSFSVSMNKGNIEALARAANLKIDGNMDKFFREDFVNKLAGDQLKR
jgi:ABC-type nitrate/sulfonate/bicarbonate transport system substrate-binding protein